MMPIESPPNPISLATFKGAPPAQRGIQAPRRVKQLVELMVFGDVDAGLEPMTIVEVAKRMRLTQKTAREYLRHAGGRAHYLACLAILRDSQRARNLHAAISIRDDGEMKKSAAGNRVRIEAAKFLEGEPADQRNANPNASATPGVVVVIGVQTGRQVDDTIIEVGPGMAVTSTLEEGR